MPMVQQNCLACGGSGRSTHVTKRGWLNEGPAYIHTEQTCTSCGGTGKVLVNQPEYNSTGRAQGTAYSKPSTPEDADEGFAKLIIFAAGAYTAYLVFGGSWEASPWEKWLLIAASMAVPWGLFRSFPRLARFLRYATIAAIILGVIWFFAR